MVVCKKKLKQVLKENPVHHLYI